MRILLLTDGIYPFQLGGMQKHSLILLQMLAERGCRVHVIHCGGEQYSRKNMRALFPSNAWSNIIETVIPFPKLDSLPGHYIRENKRYSKDAYEIIRKEQANADNERYDIVYAQGFTGAHFISERKKGQWNVPVCVNFHGFEMFQKAPSMKVMAAYVILKSTVRTMIRQADYVYSFGGHIHPLLLKEGVKEEQLLLHANGIHESWLNEAPIKVNDERKFVFIGRFERRKGVEEINQVLQLFVNSEVGFSFDFIGPIPANNRISDPRIHYLGEVRDESIIRETLGAADCLVCPSHSEGMPTVILEAMACGLAIIATDVGAVSRQIDENGILIADPDVAKIKKAMEKIINMSDQQLINMKTRSIEKIREEFLWSRIIEQKIKNFQNITQKNEKNQMT